MHGNEGDEESNVQQGVALNEEFKDGELEIGTVDAGGHADYRPRYR